MKVQHNTGGKGSARRPSTSRAYHDGWDAIFATRTPPTEDAVTHTPSPTPDDDTTSDHADK